MIIKKIKQLLLFIIYSAGIIYGLISLRYLILTIMPSLYTDSSEVYWSGNPYWSSSFINKTSFLTHATSGIFICILGPLLFHSIKKNWPSKDKLMYSYCIVSIAPTIWPFVFLFQATKNGISFYIIAVTLFLWIYCLARGFYMYKFANNQQLATTYFIYNYCISLGAFAWRIIRISIESLSNGYMNYEIMKHTGNVIDLSHPSYGFFYDASWFLALCSGITLAKFIIWANIIPFKSKESDLLE